VNPGVWADARTGRRLRKARQNAGLSHRGLSAKTGNEVSFAYISRIERGLRNPSMDKLAILATALGVTALYLATGKHDGACPFCGRH